MSYEKTNRDIVDELYGRFDPLRDIAEFHEKFGLEYNGKPRVLEQDLMEFRHKFMHEELTEYKDNAMGALFELGRKELHHTLITHHLEEQLDALVDLMYVALGTAYLHGFTREKFYEAWRRVHAANMAKVRVERLEDSKRGSKYDVVKPAGWTAPSHTDLIEDHIHVNQS